MAEDINDFLENLGFESVMVYSSPSYENAFIGVSTEGRAIYDYEKMVECLVTDGMTEEEAIEWIDFNCLGAYMGNKQPIVMYPKNS